MPCIGRPGLAFGCVTALGIFFRSIFDISSSLSLGSANQSGNARERQPQKAVAANLPVSASSTQSRSASSSFLIAASQFEFYNGMREFGF